MNGMAVTKEQDGDVAQPGGLGTRALVPHLSIPGFTQTVGRLEFTDILFVHLEPPCPVG